MQPRKVDQPALLFSARKILCNSGAGMLLWCREGMARSNLRVAGQGWFRLEDRGRSAEVDAGQVQLAKKKNKALESSGQESSNREDPERSVQFLMIWSLAGSLLQQLHHQEF